MGCCGYIIDLGLEVVVGFVGIDEVFEGSCVEDEGEPVSDGEDAAEDHQQLVPLICEPKQFAKFAGLHFPFVLSLSSCLGIVYLLSVCELDFL